MKHMEGKIKLNLKIFIKALGLYDLKLSLRRLKYYARIWLIMSRNAFMVYLSQKNILAVLLTGKIFRFFFSVIFLFFLVSGSRGLAGYSTSQVIFFFLTYNLIDITTQFLFREVYRFRPLVISGDLDLILSKPFNPLFRILMGGADVIDLITIPPVVAAIVYVAYSFHPTIINIVMYIIFVCNALVIALAFNIFVISMGIITLEVDHTIMIFRDLSRLGSVPIDVYTEPFKSFITFIIPIALMLSIPSKALMGFATLPWLIFTLCFAYIFLFAASNFWKFALKKYTSASS